MVGRPARPDSGMVGRNSQDLWIGVLRDELVTSFVVGSFDELAFLERRAGADQGNEVGAR